MTEVLRADLMMTNPRREPNFPLPSQELIKEAVAYAEVNDCRNIIVVHSFCDSCVLGVLIDVTLPLSFGEPPEFNIEGYIVACINNEKLWRDISPSSIRYATKLGRLTFIVLENKQDYIMVASRCSLIKKIFNYWCVERGEDYFEKIVEVLQSIKE